MKIAVKPGAFPPIRAHKTDAGLDLRAAHGAYVPAKGSAIVPTGIHAQIPKGHCGLLVSKSGLNTVYGITSTGLIDEGYEGEIMVKLYNHSNTSYQVEAGDKISQMVIIPCLYEDIEIVDEFSEGTERGSNGFGSTGR